MDCEVCIHFEEHPFIREYDWRNWCDKRDKPLCEIEHIDIAFCEFFEEEEFDD